MTRSYTAILVALLLNYSAATAQNNLQDWKGAYWVWDEANAHQQNQSDAPRFLRRQFTLSKAAKKGELWITADNHYTVFVNGQKVGSDGEWNTVEKYDVTKLLKVGKNIMAIEARNAGGPAGLIANLRIRTVNGDTVRVGTDTLCKVSQIGGESWHSIEFDDSSWFNAIALGSAKIGPWNIVGASSASGMDYDFDQVDRSITQRISPEQQQKHFVVPENFAVKLVVADPVVINPVSMAFDDMGRLYVSESHTYRYGPSGSPVKPFTNPVVRLEKNDKGEWQRTIVAEGFDDPVMGIACKGNKIWLSANNYLYQYDLSPEGKAINKKLILEDKNKAWNPFGMFVLEWGLDGLLYVSVGNHNINIVGPDGKITGNGSSGIIFRMNPDGTKMERLVHGLRVPYSFEMDPYDQLWLLSNGEGNPNRFVRVIEGVDYHCYSRSAVNNAWLAGNHPLAPPCFEMHRGAHTQLLRYYGSAYPQELWGNLITDNWGAHGFAGRNRGMFRFIPDANGKIVEKMPFFNCTDPHFRPSYVMLDANGEILVADWYGRDDESDTTGRIWRLKYIGKKRPKVTHSLSSAEWTNNTYAFTALGSPNHLIRDKAMSVLAIQKNRIVPSLETFLVNATPIAAAHALWTMVRINTPESKQAITSGTRHSDWKVRRLALRLLQRYNVPNRESIARKLINDDHPSVSVSAATTAGTNEERRAHLLKALLNGAAKDEHNRYEAAWHFAKYADSKTLGQLLGNSSESVRLAGMIAIDVACFENLPSKNDARLALGEALARSGQKDIDLLLQLVELNGDQSHVVALEKLIARDDVPLSITAKAILVLRAKGKGQAKEFSGKAAKQFLTAVEKGVIPIANTADQLTVFEMLVADGPSEFALNQIRNHLRSRQPQLRLAAHTLARQFGGKSDSLSEPLWAMVFAPKMPIAEVVDSLSTLARVEKTPNVQNWRKALQHENSLIRSEAVRWWRNFKGNTDMIDILVKQSPELTQNDSLSDDLGAVLRFLEISPKGLKIKVPDLQKDKDKLAAETLSVWNSLSKKERQERAVFGLQVFERNACTKCHTTATETTPLAPSLKGIASQKVDYLIESILYPSKIIKTGFDTEVIETNEGKVFNGLVKEDGEYLRILNLDRETRIAKKDIANRNVVRLSIMPEGQEAQLSRREFLDLIAYLSTLR